MIEARPWNKLLLLPILLATIFSYVEHVSADLLSGQKTMGNPLSFATNDSNHEILYGKEIAENVIIVNRQSNQSILSIAEGDNGHDSMQFEVTGLFLVNTLTGKDVLKLKNNLVIDIDEYGVDLTIRAAILNTNANNTYYQKQKRSWYVLFDLDFGQIQRVEYKMPYFLAGKDDVTYHPYSANGLVSALNQQHAITVTASGFLETLIVDNDLDTITTAGTEDDIKREGDVSSDQQQRSRHLQQRKRRTKSVGTTTTIGSGPSSDSETKDTNINRAFHRRVLDSIWNSGRSQGLSSDTNSSMNHSASTLVANGSDDGNGSLPDGGMSITFTVIDSKQNNNPTPVATMAPTLSIPGVIDGSSVDTPKAGIALVPTDDIGYQSHVLGYLNYPKTSTNDYYMIYVGDKITLGFEGPFASETGTTQRRSEYYRPSSTFADYRLDILFTTSATMTDTQPQEQIISYNVPGFYNGVGDSANTNMSSGSVWLCHFRPPVPGVYNWTASFVKGMNVAQNLGTGDSAKYMDGASGTFVAMTSTPAAGGTTTADIGTDGIAASSDSLFRNKADRLKVHKQTFGRNVYRFSNSNQNFMKVGTDGHSINILAKCNEESIASGNVSSIYAKNVSQYAIYYNEGNPTFAGGNGKCSIGAINYIANKTINTLTISTLDMDNDVHPFVSDAFIDVGDLEAATAMRFMSFDVSRLAQWDIILDWVETKGLAINMLLYSQNNNDDEDYLYDPYDAKNGALYDTRRLYYREMIARFSHHTAITWIISGMNTQNVVEQSKYIRSVDPYKSPILAGINVDDKVNSLQRVPTIDGISITFPAIMKDTKSTSIANVLSSTLGRTSKAIIEYSMIIDATLNKDADYIRQQMIGSILMGSGTGLSGGVFYNFLNIDDRRDGNKLSNVLWDQLKIASSAFWLNATSINYWDMMNSTSIVSTGSLCLSDRTGKVFVVYKTLGTITVTMNLAGGSETNVVYSVLWYNPRTGGRLMPGSVAEITLSSATKVSIGKPPSNDNEDWIAVVECTTCS